MAVPLRLFSLYYIINFSLPVLFLIFVYPKHRNARGLKLTSLGFTGVLTQEEEWVMMIVGSYLLKFRNHSTIDESVQKAFMHLKMLTLALCFQCNRTLGIYLSVGYAIAYVSIQPPRFTGASQIEYLNPVSMKSRVRTPKSKEDQKTVWLVAFWADWCEKCQFLDAMIASLSLKYSKDGLSFGKVDVVKYPELAEEFRIDTSGYSWQLPTLILFYKGVEVKRLPPFKSDGTVVKTSRMDEKGVAKVFELDKPVQEMSFRRSRKKD
mmetsp:Transcript_17256/g.35548  ORF Transcript_17256/g.35548 Transcript_17256/m.35548 type:complete len:265 (-) Transcript_17256:63-857(-)